MTENELILTSVLDCRRVDLFVDPRPLTPNQQVCVEQIQRRRQAGEPLQYILGECEFMGLKFCVDPGVLVPRPETELLVEAVLEKTRKYPLEKSVRMLDIGTGSGNIAVSLAKFLPSTRITALDISEEALDVARGNARRHGVEQKIDFRHKDMREFFSAPEAGAGVFDVIVSNPPYIPKRALQGLPRDVQQEPRLALDGGEDGLDFYRLIIAQGSRFLSSRGFLFLEIGAGQKSAVEEIFEGHPEYSSVEFFKDYRQVDRIVIAQTGNKEWKS